MLFRPVRWWPPAAGRPAAVLRRPPAARRPVHRLRPRLSPSPLPRAGGPGRPAAGPTSLPAGTMPGAEPGAGLAQTPGRPDRIRHRGAGRASTCGERLRSGPPQRCRPVMRAQASPPARTQPSRSPQGLRHHAPWPGSLMLSVPGARVPRACPAWPARDGPKVDGRYHIPVAGAACIPASDPAYIPVPGAAGTPAAWAAGITAAVATGVGIANLDAHGGGKA
jgi:hypothetical protein